MINCSACCADSSGQFNISSSVPWLNLLELRHCITILWILVCILAPVESPRNTALFTINWTQQSYRDLKQIQIKVNTRLTVVLWALLQPSTLGVFCLGQTDLLVAEVEGLLAPVPMQLQDGNEVPDGSEDGEAQDRVNMDPWVLPCAVGEALVLEHTGQWRSLSPELHKSLTKEVNVAALWSDVFV